MKKFLFLAAVTAITYFWKIRLIKYDKFRVVEKPSFSNLNSRYYEIQQFTNRGWVDLDWGDKGRYKYKGFYSEYVKNICNTEECEDCIGRKLYHIYFISAYYATEAMKEMIKFRKLVDSMPKYVVVKEMGE